MTTIALVDGIRIQMFANDHPPPNFHARYGEFEAMISIATGDVLEGSLPRAKLRVIRTWFGPRQEALAFAWGSFGWNLDVEFAEIDLCADATRIDIESRKVTEMAGRFRQRSEAAE